MTNPPTPSRLPAWLRPALAITIIAASFLWVGHDHALAALWPAIVALTTVFLLRSVLAGLFLGAACGALLQTQGRPVAAYVALINDHMIPSLQSSWNVSVVIFTLLMGGFVALIEAGGGLSGVLRTLTRHPKQARIRVEGAAFGLGLICFFDGLANSMLVGRVLRPLADRAHVSRAKLAYIVDSTSAPVACVAFISTWIAYQLSMIREGLAQVGRDDNPYVLFLQSIPLNFYCWFTLLLVLLTVIRRIDIGPMKHFQQTQEAHTDAETTGPDAGVWRAAIPLLVLMGTLVSGLYLTGTDQPWPISRTGLADAFGNAKTALVLVCSAGVGCLVAFVCAYRPGRGPALCRSFQQGLTALFLPVLILVGAWTLSSTLKELAAAEALSALLSDTLPVKLLPMAVFLVGAGMSFVTGTSWGTMGILMPLAVPSAITLGAGLSATDAHGILLGVIAAVFSGAVFGDHCSPMSDTTIVSSVSCDLDPLDHVKTQLPYALLAAVIAIAFGFIPSGLGLPAPIALLLGAGALVLITHAIRRKNA
ncbi:MAG: tetracycline resistance efflux pump [Candidatus Promineifilaceae bacterium]|jgi:tetracycline resistance efflux pump